MKIPFDTFIILNSQVLQDIKDHGIKTYEFPECDQDEDEGFKQRDAEMKVSNKPI